MIVLEDGCVTHRLRRVVRGKIGVERNNLSGTSNGVVSSVQWSFHSGASWASLHIFERCYRLDMMEI